MRSAAELESEASAVAVVVGEVERAGGDSRSLRARWRELMDERAALLVGDVDLLARTDAHEATERLR